MKATVSGLMASRAVSRSLKGKWRNPGSMGSKPILILSCPVADMLPSVLPWKDLLNVSTS